MRVGINNIFTTFWFTIMLIFGGLLSNMAIDKGLLFSDLIFVAKFFLGFIIILTISIAGFFIYKFRFLIVTDHKIISFNPFILKLRQIEYSNISKIDWKTWDIKTTRFKTIHIYDTNNGFIAFSDFEFENFDTLINKIPNQINDTKRKRIEYNQAKSNISFMTFVIIANLGFICFISWFTLTKKDNNQFTLIFLTAAILLTYAAFKRRKKYKLLLITPYNPQ